MLEILINENVAVPKVKDAILSEDKIVLLYGWRDGGKSTSAIRILILLCMFSKKFRCAHVRQHYNELSGTTFLTICSEIKKMGLSDFFYVTKQNFMITYKPDPDKFFFGASGDKPDKIRSTPNVTHVFWDEMHDCTAQTFGSILGTIREEKDSSVITKFIGLFNNDKVPYGSFIHDTFFEKKLIKARIELIQHTNNPFIDQEKTKEKLIIVCLGDEAKYNAFTNGEFSEEEDVKKWCEHLDPERHFSETNLLYDRNLPLYIYFDNNYNPFVGVFIQYDKMTKSLRVLEEVSFEKSTPDDLHSYAVKKYPYSVRIWGGDKSAEMIFKSIYNLEVGAGVRSAVVRFCRGDYNANYAKSNPNFDNNFTTVNTVLRYFPTFKISPLCPNLKREMKDAKIDNKKGGFTLFKTQGDSKYSMNYFDALRYFIGDHLKEFVNELNIYE